MYPVDLLKVWLSIIVKWGMVANWSQDSHANPTSLRSALYRSDQCGLDYLPDRRLEDTMEGRFECDCGCWSGPCGVLWHI